MTNERTQLHRAVQEGNAEVAEALILAGADLDAKQQDNRTPLHLAVFWGRQKIAEVLIQAGADVNAKDENDRTPLHLAAKTRGCQEIAKSLIQGGADVNAKDIDAKQSEGMSASQLALTHNRAGITEMLIKELINAAK